MSAVSEDSGTDTVFKDAINLLRKGMLEQDLSHKQLADRISRSVSTVKRALNGEVGERTVYRILKEFGETGKEENGNGVFERQA